VIRPVGGQTGILLAGADGDQQTRIVGEQFAGRVGMFLRVDDFDSAWSPPVCGSSRRLAMSHTADLQCSWISRGIAGTSWDGTRGDRCQSATADICRSVCLCQHPAPSTAPSTRHPAPGTQHSTRHPAQHPAPGTKHPAPVQS
jgi:hypothetical protein